MDSELKNRLVNNAFYEGGMTEDFVFGAEWMYTNQVLPLLKQNEELKQKLEVAKKALELVTNEQNKHWCTWQMLSEARQALEEIGE